MISAIVVAAGLSTRMGEDNKLLLAFRGKALWLHLLDAVLDSKVEEVVVVTGFEAEKIKETLGLRKVKLSHNKNYPNGLTSSIQTGLKTCQPATHAFLICLSDMPFIKSHHINKILTAFDPNLPQQIIQPHIRNQATHPILFPVFYKEKIIQHKMPNGCKKIIKENAKNIRLLHFEEDFSQDIDTPKTYLKFYEGN